MSPRSTQACRGPVGRADCLSEYSSSTLAKADVGLQDRRGVEGALWRRSAHLQDECALGHELCLRGSRRRHLIDGEDLHGILRAALGVGQSYATGYGRAGLLPIRMPGAVWGAHSL